MGLLTTNWSYSSSKGIFLSFLTLICLIQLLAPFTTWTWCALVGFFTVFYTTYFTITKNDPTTPSPTSTDNLIPTASPTPTKTPNRLYFLDNLKIFLTVTVITHHQTGALSGGGGWPEFSIGNYPNCFRSFASAYLIINQSYFMCAFFFISGYFTPTSFSRKGRFLFLRDKLIRLGWPFIIYMFILQPLGTSIIQLNCFGSLENLKNALFLGAGPTWFAAWLLIFNSIYAVTDHSAAAGSIVKFPSLIKLLLILLGFHGLDILTLSIGGEFGFMPISFGSLPFDILFFYSGTVAKNSGWLAEGENSIFSKMDGFRPFLYGMFVLTFGGILVGSVVMFATGWVEDPNDAFDPVSKVGPYAWLFICLPPWLIIYFASLVMLDFFRMCFNFTTPATANLAGAAYGAYIIHPIFLDIFTGIFVRIYETANDDTIVFVGSNTTSTTELIDGEYWLWGGWAGLNCVTVCMSFLAAYLFRQYVPGAKKVL